MDDTRVEDFVRDLYAGVLRRDPSPREFRTWCDVVRSGRAPEQLVRDFATCEEFRQRNRVVPLFPDGHYYSAIVDPGSLGGYPATNRARAWSDLPGIALDPEAMAQRWTAMLPAIRGTPFPETADGVHRFCYDNQSFPIGDAVILRAMMLYYRPARIIEIGSGCSSACMLDVADEGAFPPPLLTCIDPYADRLRAAIREGDRLEIIERPVQEVSLDRFAALRAGDILFIDSAHVLKTGSDVHYELFYILPVLRPGVLVHFHDVPFPFEYHDAWIHARNHSWNEAYAVQAFLMFNNRFSVHFWASMLAATRRPLIEQTWPSLLRNCGSGLWVVRQEAAPIGQ